MSQSESKGQSFLTHLLWGQLAPGQVDCIQLLSTVL